MKEEPFSALMKAIANGDSEQAKNSAKELIEKGIDPSEAITKGVMKAVRIAGERWNRLEIFLPDVIMSAEATNAAIGILGPHISKEEKKKIHLGVVVLGTVKGDIHDIGKNIVAAMLISYGFEVHDIGVDVPASEFIEKAKELNADIIAVSALLTTSISYQRDIIDFLKAQGIRDKFKVLIGGGPTSQEWADEIGADGWAPDANASVKAAKKLVGRN